MDDWSVVIRNVGVWPVADLVEIAQYDDAEPWNLTHVAILPGNHNDIVDAMTWEELYACFE